MLEIILVIALCSALGKMLRAKGRKPIWLQVMLVVMWILGEFTGAIVGTVIHVIRNGQDAPMGFEVYLMAMLGAAVGAGITFLIAAFLPSNTPQPQHAPLPIDPFDQARPSDPNNPYAP